MPKKEGLELSEEGYKRYCNFFEYFRKKQGDDCKKEIEVMISMDKFFHGISYYGVMQYCALGGGEWVEEWGMENIGKIRNILYESKEKGGYKTVEDPFSMFETVEAIYEICLEGDELIGRKYELTAKLEKEFGENGKKRLLKYLVEVFRAVWDTDNKLWDEYRLTTLFAL